VVQYLVVRLPASLETVQNQGVAGSDHLLGEPDDFGMCGAAVFRLSKGRGGSLPSVKGCRRIRLCIALGCSHVSSLPSLGTRGFEARKGFLAGAHENAMTTDSVGQSPIRVKWMSARLPFRERRAS
jgi:hypothetical protein